MAKLIGSYEVEFVDGEDTTELLVRQENGVAALSKAFKLAGNGDLAGEEVAWQRGDGYARYLVVREKPLQLMHLAIGDAWSVEEALIRGLRKKDVRELVRRRKALDSIFAAPKEKEMDKDTAHSMAMECLLIRADQWREMGEIKTVDLEEMYESTPEECLKMSAMYRTAYLALGGT
jgi:hypothetical protein